MCGAHFTGPRGFCWVAHRAACQAITTLLSRPCAAPRPCTAGVTGRSYTRGWTIALWLPSSFVSAVNGVNGVTCEHRHCVSAERERVSRTSLSLFPPFKKKESEETESSDSVARAAQMWRDAGFTDTHNHVHGVHGVHAIIAVHALRQNSVVGSHGLLPMLVVGHF